MEMPPVSNVTPLPTRPEMILRSGNAGGLVAENDQGRRFGAALRDTQQRPHAELAHAVLIQNLAFETVFIRHFRSAIGEHCGRENISGFVGQIAGKVLRFAQDAAPIEGGFRGAQDGERIDALFVFLRVGLIAVVSTSPKIAPSTAAATKSSEFGTRRPAPARCCERPWISASVPPRR